MAFGTDGRRTLNVHLELRQGLPDGRHARHTAATFTTGVAIPEYVFVCFQMTFAAITVALVLGRSSSA